MPTDSQPVKVNVYDTMAPSTMKIASSVPPTYSGMAPAHNDRSAQSSYDAVALTTLKSGNEAYSKSRATSTRIKMGLALLVLVGIIATGVWAAAIAASPTSACTSESQSSTQEKTILPNAFDADSADRSFPVLALAPDTITSYRVDISTDLPTLKLIQNWTHCLAPAASGASAIAWSSYMTSSFKMAMDGSWSSTMSTSSSLLKVARLTVTANQLRSLCNADTRVKTLTTLLQLPVDADNATVEADGSMRQYKWTVTPESVDIDESLLAAIDMSQVVFQRRVTYDVDRKAVLLGSVTATASSGTVLLHAAAKLKEYGLEDAVPVELASQMLGSASAGCYSGITSRTQFASLNTVPQQHRRDLGESVRTIDSAVTLQLPSSEMYAMLVTPVLEAILPAPEMERITRADPLFGSEYSLTYQAGFVDEPTVSVTSTDDGFETTVEGTYLAQAFIDSQQICQCIFVCFCIESSFDLQVNASVRVVHSLQLLPGTGFSSAVSAVAPTITPLGTQLLPPDTDCTRQCEPVLKFFYDVPAASTCLERVTKATLDLGMSAPAMQATAATAWQQLVQAANTGMLRDLTVEAGQVPVPLTLTSATHVSPSFYLGFDLASISHAQASSSFPSVSINSTGSKSVFIHGQALEALILSVAAPGAAVYPSATLLTMAEYGISSVVPRLAVTAVNFGADSSQPQLSFTGFAEGYLLPEDAALQARPLMSASFTATLTLNVSNQPDSCSLVLASYAPAVQTSGARLNFAHDPNDRSWVADTERLVVASLEWGIASALEGILDLPFLVPRTNVSSASDHLYCKPGTLSDEEEDDAIVAGPTLSCEQDAVITGLRQASPLDTTPSVTCSPLSSLMAAAPLPDDFDGTTTNWSLLKDSCTAQWQPTCPASYLATELNVAQSLVRCCRPTEARIRWLSDMAPDVPSTVAQSCPGGAAGMGFATGRLVCQSLQVAPKDATDVTVINGACSTVAGATQCQCYPGWVGELCTVPCPGGVLTPCNHNGVCMENASCACNYGWAGPTCSTLQCEETCSAAGRSKQHQECGCVEEDRECAEGCVINLLGDNECQPRCYVPECNFDEGDCAADKQCHCPLAWLDNTHCDANCHTPNCDMDGGDCDCDCDGDAASMSQDCRRQCKVDSPCQDSFVYGDGFCDAELNTLACNYDGGDCKQEDEKECSEGCPASLLGNGFCDTQCNTSDCLFDGSDCVTEEACGNDGCRLWQRGDGFCQKECNVAECGLDDGDCFDCATEGCKHGYCDSITRRCRCFPGYYGQQCDVLDQERLCHQRGVCSNSTNLDAGCESCLCEYGYIGRFCETWDPTACLQGKVAGDEECMCHDGWHGSFCTRCRPGMSACGSRGECISAPASDHDTCDCSEGWTGSACELCDANKLCQGRGTCNKEGRCTCQPPYTGVECQSCSDAYCSLNGQCNVGSDGTTNCACSLGWQGERCETCDDGFTGDRCDSCQEGMYLDLIRGGCFNCSTCSAGEGLIAECTNASDTQCQGCEVGQTFLAESNHLSACLTCALCPIGQGVVTPCTPTADTTCEACVDGLTYSLADDYLPCQSCVECPVGEGGSTDCFASSNTVCEACSQGFFSAEISYGRCKECEWTCDAGFELRGECTATTGSTCKPCPDGFAKEGAGADLCTPCVDACPPGQGGGDICRPTSHPTCVDCSAGSYSLSNSSDPCSLCLVKADCDDGSELTGVCSPTTATACSPCTGDTWKYPVSSECESRRLCAAGTYTSSQGSASANRECEPCPPNTFLADSAHTVEACMPMSLCPAGHYASFSGSSELDRVCAPCAAGSFQPASQSIAPSCTAFKSCGAAQFLAMVGTATSDVLCDDCPTGTFQSSASHTETVCSAFSKCNAGTYIAAEGTASTDRVCLDCPFETGYQPEPQHELNACLPKSLCQPGQRVASTGTTSTDRVCVACEAGTFSSQQQHTTSTCTAWSTCQVGNYATTEEGTSTSDRSCAPCPAGTFNPSSGVNRQCSNCSPGTFSAAGAVSCSSCGDSAYSSAGASSCIGCRAGCSSSEVQTSSCGPSSDR